MYKSHSIFIFLNICSFLMYIIYFFCRYLSDLTSKIESRKLQLTHLESQRSEIKNTATKEARSLERQKLGHLKRLEEVSKII